MAMRPYVAPSLISLVCATCAQQLERTSGECHAQYSREEVRRWRKDVRGAVNNVQGIVAVGVYRIDCHSVVMEAESIRSQLDRELRRRGVPLEAVQVQVGRVVLD